MRATGIPPSEAVGEATVRFGWEARLAKAHGFLDTARACLKNDPDTATSRAYYAAFQAGVAFLEQHPDHPKKPPGADWNEKEIRSGLAKHFRAALRGGMKAHKLLGDLLSERVAADYFVASIGEERARESIARAEDFIQAIEDELVRRGMIKR